MEIDGAALRRLRTERAYSLRELAQIAGTTQEAIWKIESGRTQRPHGRTIRKLAAALGVEPKALMPDGPETGKAAA